MKTYLAVPKRLDHHTQELKAIWEIRNTYDISEGQRAKLLAEYLKARANDITEKEFWNYRKVKTHTECPEYGVWHIINAKDEDLYFVINDLKGVDQYTITAVEDTDHWLIFDMMGVGVVFLLEDGNLPGEYKITN